MASEEELRIEAENALLKGALPTQLGAAAGAVREGYDAWLEVGFTKKQALWLCACMFLGSPGDPPLDDEE